MSHARPCLLATFLLMAGVSAPAWAGGFTVFAEDEDACRHYGAAAIAGAAGPEAAHRYDQEYGRCMAARGRMRQMRAYQDGSPGPRYRPGNPGAGFPDAFYSIPYATPGYGYDGFSY